MSHLYVCTRKWTDNVQIWVQFLTAILKPIWEIWCYETHSSGSVITTIWRIQDFRNFHPRKSFNLSKADPIKQQNQMKPSKHKGTMTKWILSVCQRRTVYATDHERWEGREWIRLRERELMIPVKDFTIIRLIHSWSGCPSIIRICPFGSMTSFLILYLCCLIMGHAGQETFVLGDD